jgi:hypothetical protein
MTDHQTGKGTVQDVYDLLAEEFTRAARTERRRPLHSLPRRALIVPLAVLGLAGGATGGLAIAGEFSGPQATFVSANGGQTSTITGTYMTQLPLFAPGTTYANCPQSVRDSLSQIDNLSDYAQTPGYPVTGCPTLDELRQELQDNSSYLSALNALRARSGKLAIDPNSP